MYHDHTNDTYIKLLEDGSEQKVIKVSNDEVRVHLKELMQFLAARKMTLAIYFVITRFHSTDVDKIQENDRRVEHIDTDLLSKFVIDKLEKGMIQNFTSRSRFRGKKLLHGPSIEDSGLFPELKYEQFIIDVDENGNEVEFSSNPDELDNQFGKNPNSPNYLTRVFFRKEILQRYYNEPEKYAVEDGILYFSGVWHLMIDNNHPNYVIVFLGDLGSSLPYSEQKIWRAYNVTPDGELSEVGYRRSILGEFVDATDPILRFKADFSSFQERWYEKFGWYLFKPINKKDKYHFTSLSVPLSNNFSKFDSAILSLTKILIDSLNESELVKEIETDIPENTKGIGKFELYLVQKGLIENSKIIDFMKYLQRIRSTSSAHRKSSNFDKNMKKIGTNLDDLGGEFSTLIERSILMLETLNIHFIGDLSSS